MHASAAVAAGDPAEAAKTPPKPWPGIKLVPLLASCAIGLALRFLVPVPAGLTTQAWTLLSIFVSTIAGTSTYKQTFKSLHRTEEHPWCCAFQKILTPAIYMQCSSLCAPCSLWLY